MTSLCPRCGKDNQAHYKFCLGCGAELGSLSGTQPAPARAPVHPTAPTMMAEAPRLPTAPPVFDDMGPKDEGASAPAGATDPEIPDLLNRAAGGESEPAAPAHTCTRCGASVAGGYKFCPGCGAPVDAEETAAHVTAPVISGGEVHPSAAPAGRLVLMRPDGTEGGEHPLVLGENKIGRGSGPLFEADGYLSPLHAEMVLNAAGMVLRDLGSLNGVFVKITAEEELEDGDVLRVGQELLRFDAIPAPQPLDDGTEILGSPNPGYWGRLAVIVGKDQDGSAFPLFGDAVILGRERGDLTFPEDGYVSGTHARVSLRDGRFWLSDLNSSNGTFVRIRGERAIPSGGYVLLGQQLFRVVYQ